MKSSGAGYDVHDITDLVTPVVAESPLLPGTPMTGFTNGKSFFFAAAQTEQIAALVPQGQLRPPEDGGWEEVVPGKGLRFLAERRIKGADHYRFRKHWGFLDTTA
jgi:hypothetical protein